MAGGTGLTDLLDCTGFVTNISDAGLVRKAFAASDARPLLSIFQVDGLEKARQTVELRCTASLPKKEIQRPLGAANDRFVFTSTLGRKTDGSDTFAALEAELNASGLGLQDVVNCLFFVQDQNKVFDLFGGFFKAFNQNHPPPPSRGEFQAKTECADCQMAAKCISALPSDKSKSLVSRNSARDLLV